jgi:hypothetical protein
MANSAIPHTPHLYGASGKYSEELWKGWKEARYNGLWSMEVDLLRIIEGKGLRWGKFGYENTRCFKMMLHSIQSSVGP